MTVASAAGIWIFDEGARVPERTVAEADVGEAVLEAVPEGVAAALAEVEPEICLEGLEEGETLDAGQVRQFLSNFWAQRFFRSMVTYWLGAGPAD